MAALDELVGLIAAQAEALGMDPRELTPEEIDIMLAALDDEALDAALVPILSDEDYLRFNKYRLFFPDAADCEHVDPRGHRYREIAGTRFYSRQDYPKHVEFFGDGAKHRERLFLAANRIGKTIAGSFECTAHLTGEYHDWWPGYRFHKPVRAWAAGDTNETTRDIIQLELLGQVIGMPDGRKGVDGSGMIPRECIGPVKWKQGVQDLVDTVMIRHVSGWWSMLGFKSFDQGRRSFQGTAKELIWLDEECPEDVYGECYMRTATTRGRLLTTFTPLKGLTPVVLSFLPDDMRPAA